MLGFVAIGGAGGAILGVAVDAVVRLLLTDVARGLIPAGGAIIGFGLGWWSAATVGQRWLAEDNPSELGPLDES